MRSCQAQSDSADRPAPISSEDGALSFVIRRTGGAVYVERIQPLRGIGELSHLMRFEDLASFVAAYETDHMRFTYPLVYWRLRRAVERSLVDEV